MHNSSSLLRQHNLQVVDELLAVMKQQGKLHECAALLEDMLQHHLTCHGPHNIRTLKHQAWQLMSFSPPLIILRQIKLATMYQRSGRIDDAEASFRDALSSLQQHHSADNAAALECLSSLGSLLKQLGRLDEASPLLSSAFDGCRRVYGPDHSKTIVVQNNFAFLLMDRAVAAQDASDISSETIFDDAERMMRDALSRQLGSVGESDPITLQTMHNLAALLDLRGHDSDEAIEFMRRAVRCRSASLGLSNAHTIASQHGLVKMLLKRGKDGVSEAEEVMQSMITAQHNNIDEWVKVRARKDSYSTLFARHSFEFIAGCQNTGAALEGQSRSGFGAAGQGPFTSGFFKSCNAVVVGFRRCHLEVRSFPDDSPSSHCNGKSKRAAAAILSHKLLMIYGMHGMSRFAEFAHAQKAWLTFPEVCSGGHGISSQCSASLYKI